MTRARECRHGKEHCASISCAYRHSKIRRSGRAAGCPWCGGFISLGPSADDDERVKVEIRAAEIVADARPVFGGHFVPTDVMEWAGWVSHKEGHAVSTGRGLAGWLAREIFTHPGGEGEL